MASMHRLSSIWKAVLKFSYCVQMCVCINGWKFRKSLPNFEKFEMWMSFRWQQPPKCSLCKSVKNCEPLPRDDFNRSCILPPRLLRGGEEGLACGGKQNHSFSKKNRFSNMKGSFGHYLLFRHTRLAPSPPLFSSLKAPAAFRRNSFYWFFSSDGLNDEK